MPVAPPAHAPEPFDLPTKLALARLANGISPASVAMAFTDWAMHVASSPTHRLKLASRAFQDAVLWGHYLAQAGRTDCARCIEPAAQDKRFSRPEWKQQPWHALSQAFLLTQSWWHDATAGVRGVSRHHEELVEFLVRQWQDMLSPSNFVVTNPQVLWETARTGGMNLTTGWMNWARDFAAWASDGMPRGAEDFLPGRKVAVTPGSVVYRNRLIELIQYTPTTAKVHKRPILVVPSWIMKFYILDLLPEESMVKYLVAQGHTVFIISWRNPGADDRELGLDDYERDGVAAAVAEVQRRCPDTTMQAVGYCLGGTLLAMYAAAAARRPHNPLHSISLLAAETDFSEPGELGLFIDESQITFLEDLMAEHGYLDGRQMAGAFQLINSKDLVWSKLVHEYLMGAQTPMTSLRAWNADATRLPARMHSEYLRQLYLNNDLAEGRLRVQGERVDLSDIRQPMFVVGTEWDHVSPWRSVFKIHRLAGSEITFALTTSGHNVGIVNPPGAQPPLHPPSSYLVATSAPRAAPEPDGWLQGARREEGSWWSGWSQWLHAHGDGMVPARRVKDALEAAPGRYVHQR